MLITLVSGTHRPQGNSNRVTDFVERLVREELSAETFVVKLSSAGLPFYDDTFPDGPGWTAWGPIRDKLRASDAVVVATPEWAGAAAPGVKNFFTLTGARELGHKPALLVTVTATPTNGAYPVAELRATATKNNRMVWIPDHIIVRNANDVLVDAEPRNEGDRLSRLRLRAAVKELGAYAEAMSGLAAKVAWDFKTFGNGM